MNAARRTATTPTEFCNNAAPSNISAYRVLEQIGEGGWATVHRVVHERTGREYAMKRARLDVPVPPADMARLMVNEARIALRARHAGVVEIVDLGADSYGRMCLIMELLDGVSLREVALGDHVYSPGWCVTIARQIAEALDAVHTTGAVHCDVSPGNVFLRGGPEGGQATVIDFGSSQARDLGPAPRLVPEGMISGTPFYVSPEQARGEPMDARSDIYSLGVILFELLAGEPPFTDHTMPGLLLQHVHQAPPAPHSPFGTLPADLSAIVLRCLAKSPSARFQSARALAVALDAVDWNELGSLG